MKTPLFITFEGIEGSGKSTQIRLLAERLERSGCEVVLTREPGGCPISDAIRRILLDPANGAMTPLTELLLYAAARAQHTEEIIRPALQSGKVVLCDRFTDATTVYQGYGRGLDLELISTLNEVARGTVIPDLTLLLDMPAEEGLGRARRRNEADAGAEGRFEEESLAFHRRIREGYRAMAAAEPGRFRLVDATGSPQMVADRISDAVESIVPGGAA